MRVILDLSEETLENYKATAQLNFMSRKKFMEKVLTEYIKPKDYSSKINDLKFVKTQTDRIALNKVPIEGFESKIRYTETTPESYAGSPKANISLEEQLTAVKSAKMPDGIAKKVWEFDQRKKITALEQQLKDEKQ